ncbi:MAG TPA: tetratricopeptide repeat protein [Candidatus Saccharimonadales bacterium]|nr:tetratricopeptide repeat protein [Candidatus Saccharimonadales bacterium]
MLVPLTPATSAQSVGALQSDRYFTESGISSAPSASVYVSVRESTGLPVDKNATVKLLCPLAGINLNGPTQGTAAQVQFNNIPVGDCNIEVSAAGYRTAKDRTEVLQSSTNHIQYVFIYLHPESESATAALRPPAVPLGLLKEMDKAIEALQKKKIDDARKHLDKAARLSPSNPDVAYLQGTMELDQHNLPAAEQYFQKAVNSPRASERALLGLGYAQLQSNQPGDAAQTLEKALQLNTTSERGHLLLANAYAQLQEYSKAREHAQRAAAFNSENAASARTLLAQILAAEGNREGAKLEYQAISHDFPNSPSAVAAKNGMEGLASTSAPSETSVSAIPKIENSVLAPVSAASVSTWAPPNVDTDVPGVAKDVTCSAEDIVERTSKNTVHQLENLEKFLATEHIQHEEINSRGEVSQVREKDFSYMVFIDHDKDGLVFLNENRNGGTGTDSFPTSLATVGLVSLGVDVFHPGFSKALDFKCEGLGQWRGMAAWVLHFEQRPNVKSYLRLWETRTRTVEIPLKGRVWVAASSYDVLHVESDLREPMKELELTRDHLAIDYGPVAFNGGKTELWLPWYADMYLELHGKRYHHNHTLSNFSLFGVDTDSKIGLPKGYVPPPDVQNQEHPQPPPSN